MQTDMEDQISPEQMLRVFILMEYRLINLLDMVNGDSGYKAD